MHNKTTDIWQNTSNC